MFVSYLLAQSGMDGVVRPSTHVQGGQKRDFWRDGLGFEAPEFLKAGSGRPALGPSSPAFTSLHRGKVRSQGSPLAGSLWGQAILWGAYLGEQRG